jgi:ABC-type glycerol-3-phosphate transport system substrate-binding protein
MADEGLLAPGVASMTASDTINLWTAGRVAVLGGSKYHANLVRDAINDGTLDMEYNVIPIPMPTENGQGGYAAIGPTGFSVFSDDQAKQEAAAEFIEFAMQPEWWEPTVAGSGQFPATKSVAEMNIYEGDEYQQIVQGFITEFPAGDFALSSPNYNEIRIELSSAGQAIFSGRQEIEPAVEAFLAEVQELEE